MNNSEKHFKDREPLETINIVKDFFRKKNLKIYEESFRESEIGTYSNRFELTTQTGLKVLGANGKGMTPEYCKASGLGELYERFCNYCMNINNNFFTNIYFQNNTKLKQMTYEEALSPIFLQKYFKALLGDNKDKIKDFVSTRLNNKFYGQEFTNLFTNEKKYFEVQLIDLACTSIGLAAGNTLNEALNQAMSEWFEKLIQRKFYSKPQEKYYCIDFNTINNQKIKTWINNIHQLGYKFYIVDLSYNFNMPVLMSVLINNKEQNITINFGSFPVIDIALERIITELYQGIASFKDFPNPILIPSRNIEVEEVLRTNHSSHAHMRTFPEDFFNKIEYTSYNKEMFLEGSFENEYLKNYLLNIYKKLNYSIYYADQSQMDELIAIRVLVPEENIRDDMMTQFARYDTSSIEKYSLNHYIFIKMIQDNVDNQTLINFYKTNCLEVLDHLENVDKNFLADLTIPDMLSPTGLNFKGSLGTFFQDLYYNPSMTEYKVGVNGPTIFYTYIKKYLTLKTYINSRKYSKEEIKNFFKIFEDEITDKDFIYINNFDYLFEQIYLIPVKKFINSNEYKNLVLTIAGLT